MQALTSIAIKYIAPHPPTPFMYVLHNWFVPFTEYQRQRDIHDNCTIVTTLQKALLNNKLNPCPASYVIYGHPKCSTHQCTQTSSPSCSLDQSLCTRTFHLGFVGNFGSWEVQPYYRHHLDLLHPRRPSTPVGLVGCTTLLQWALVLWVAESTLSPSPRQSASHLEVSRSDDSRHTAGKLQRL